jgi:hypothetical protein
MISPKKKSKSQIKVGILRKKLKSLKKKVKSLKKKVKSLKKSKKIIKKKYNLEKKKKITNNNDDDDDYNLLEQESSDDKEQNVSYERQGLISSYDEDHEDHEDHGEFDLETNVNRNIFSNFSPVLRNYELSLSPSTPSIPSTPSAPKVNSRSRSRVVGRVDEIGGTRRSLDFS